MQVYISLSFLTHHENGLATMRGRFLVPPKFFVANGSCNAHKTIFSAIRKATVIPSPSGNMLGLDDYLNLETVY